MNTTAQPPTSPSLPWRRLLVALVLACVGRTGLATLGAAPATPAKAPSSVNTAYTVTESLLDNGTRVQEFVTPAGLVFAVNWRGPVLPDLRALLGDYMGIFQRYTDAARQAGLRGGPVNLAQAAGRAGIGVCRPYRPSDAGGSACNPGKGPKQCQHRLHHH